MPEGEEGDQEIENLFQKNNDKKLPYLGEGNRHTSLVFLIECSASKNFSHCLYENVLIWLNVIFLINNIFLSTHRMMGCFFVFMISDKKSVITHIEVPLYVMSYFSGAWKFLKKLIMAICQCFCCF